MSNLNTIVKKAQSTNPYRMKLSALAKSYGYDDVTEFVTEACDDSVVPACCTEGCEVEPDGTCEHGCPSPLMALGII
jgi:hypothetical protein